MSWDSYVDSLATYAVDAKGGSHLDTGCIIGLNGAIWTTAANAKHLNVTQQEAMTIGQCFTNKDFAVFQQGGLKVAGVQYMYLRSEDGGDSITVYGKKKDQGSIVLQSSKQAIVVGHCPEGSQQGTCSVAVGKIADYLSSLGY